MRTGPLCPQGSLARDGVLTCTFISRSVSQIRMIRTSPELMRRPVSCSQSTTIPAPGEIQMGTSVTEGAWSGQLLKLEVGVTIQSLSISLLFSGICQKDSSISEPFVQDAAFQHTWA